MSTDQELRTKQYISEIQRLRLNILYTSNWLNAQIRDFLKPYGLTSKQYNILRILRGHKGEAPISIHDIRTKMIDEMSDVSRLIDRLEKKKLVTKNVSNNDRRSIRIEITQSALDLLLVIDKNMPKLDAQLGNIGETTALQLNNGLNDLRTIKTK